MEQSTPRLPFLVNNGTSTPEEVNLALELWPQRIEHAAHPIAKLQRIGALGRVQIFSEHRS
jgi:hypothetical protein